MLNDAALMLSSILRVDACVLSVLLEPWRQRAVGGTGGGLGVGAGRRTSVDGGVGDANSRRSSYDPAGSAASSPVGVRPVEVNGPAGTSVPASEAPGAGAGDGAGQAGPEVDAAAFNMCPGVPGMGGLGLELGCQVSIDCADGYRCEGAGKGDAGRC